MTSTAALAGLIHESGALGLRAGTVDVVKYNPVWPQIYEQMREHLSLHLSAVACSIEHIGSTSVPGLAAKPILDIAIGASPPDPSTFTGPLADAGFAFEADLGIYGGLFYTFKPEPDVAVAHLHVVDIDEFQWRWYLAFRDGLRADAGLVSEYATLKARAANANETNRDGYTKEKFDWVLETVGRLTSNDPPSDHG